MRSVTKQEVVARLLAILDKIFEEVTPEHISWFEKIVEDPSVDKDRSYLKVTMPSKIGRWVK